MSTFGNKRTVILTQTLTTTDDGSTLSQAVNHESVDAAKSFFYTADALTVFNECCNQIEWALVDNKLKYTCTFIHNKGSEYHSRMQALQAADNWSLNGHTTEVVDSHLF